jgi:hypothetical protein
MAVNLVLDNGNFPFNDANVLVAAGLRVGSDGVASGGAGTFTNQLNLQGFPTVPSAPGPAQNEFLLNGAYIRQNAGTFTAPQTAAANMTLQIIDGAFPQLQLQMNQTAPLLEPSAVALNVYATANTSQANSQLVSRTFVSSQPQNYPAGSAASLSPNGGAAHTQTLAADVIACPTVTANSIFRTWLAGLTGVVGATAVAPATISAITPGTGFTINGTVGAIYGYELLYA